MSDDRPKVGVGVMILRDGKVLLGKRKNAHGEGEYSWPGGHLEYMESVIDCAHREVKEETAMDIDNLRFLRIFNMKAYSKHYINIGMVADWKKGEAELREPDKCFGWDWYSFDNLPQPLFVTIPSHIEAYKTGRSFWDA